MKESKKREHSSTKKKKHGSPLSTDSWNQANLEEGDQSLETLEKKRHLIQMQLRRERKLREKHLSAKRKKKHLSEDSASSDSDSSLSESSFSSASSSSVNKYKSKKSSSSSEDEKKKFLRSSLPKKKHVKDVKSSRSSHDYKTEKKIIIRRKTSPINDKSSSRGRTRKSPSLDKRDLYSRLDTGRWHEKAKEFEKERSRGERDASRSRARTDRNRSVSPRRDSRHTSRAKDDRPHPKKTAPPPRTISSTSRRKDSPEPTRTRNTYDSGRRTAVVARKVSPRDERVGRHDERRLDLKATRRNDVRSGDSRDVNSRITRDVRDRKDPPPKPLDKGRERPAHRDVGDHARADRDRSKANDDRVKERDKRLAHDRLESERNVRSGGARDPSDDKFRRNERNAVVDVGRLGNNRHPGGAGESVFDRMRNRYNDRRNAENQRLGRERAPVDVRKERPEVRPSEMNGVGERLAVRDRRLNAVVAPVPQLPALMSLRSGINIVERRTPPPLIPRERKEPERNAVARSPPNFDHKFSSPLTARRSRDLDHRTSVKRRSSVEHDDPAWARKKGLNKLRSRSRSSEKRKRRRSSQEEWRVIDMTSPVLDGEFSDENIGTSENLSGKLKRCVANKLSLKVEDGNNTDKDKSNLNDELSDISDEDFNDVNGTNSLRIKRESIVKNDRVTVKTEENCANTEQKTPCDREDFDFEKTSSLAESKPLVVANDVDVLIKGEKLMDEEENERAVHIDKAGDENFDSEEETVSRVSDALGVDWADLVEESKRKAALGGELSASSVRRRWNTAIVFAKVGVSEKYAGEDVFDSLQIDLEKEVASENASSEDCKLKILHKMPALHTCLKVRAVRRQTLFEPYKTAISARKDIAIRRRLCGLPVKNLPSQQMIGICH